MVLSSFCMLTISKIFHCGMHFSMTRKKMFLPSRHYVLHLKICMERKHVCYVHAPPEDSLAKTTAAAAVEAGKYRRRFALPFKR